MTVREIPYKMDERAWRVIMKDGIARGHAPRQEKFYVDEHTLTGMMFYYGKPWVFPVERVDE